MSLRLFERFKHPKTDSINDIYKEIVNKFPVGRLASYLLNNTNIDKNSVLEQLVDITNGLDSDGKYTDKQSKKSAQEFIDKLNSQIMKYNKSKINSHKIYKENRHQILEKGIESFFKRVKVFL